MIASHFSSADITDTTMADCAAARGAGASALFFSSIRLDTADMQRMAAEFDGGCAFVRLMSNASISRLNCVQGTALAATGAGYGSGGAFSGALPQRTHSPPPVFCCMACAARSVLVGSLKLALDAPPALPPTLSLANPPSLPPDPSRFSVCEPEHYDFGLFFPPLLFTHLGGAPGRLVHDGSAPGGRERVCQHPWRRRWAGGGW